MTSPAWFDEAHFCEQRAQQLNVVKFCGKDDWTVASFRLELATRNITAYQDFESCNDVHDLRFTNISPNPLFDVREYLTAWAEFANADGYSWPGYEAGKWTAQTALEHMFNELHVSAWDHFTLSGQYNLVNPSNAFDIKAYYERLTVLRNDYTDAETGLRGWEGRTDWTLDDVLEDCIWAEMNPIMGLGEDGSAQGVEVSGASADEAVEIDPAWNPWIGAVEYMERSDKATEAEAAVRSEVSGSRREDVERPEGSDASGEAATAGGVKEGSGVAVNGVAEKNEVSSASAAQDVCEDDAGISVNLPGNFRELENESCANGVMDVQIVEKTGGQQALGAENIFGASMFCDEDGAIALSILDAPILCLHAQGFAAEYAIVNVEFIEAPAGASDACLPVLPLELEAQGMEYGGAPAEFHNLESETVVDLSVARLSEASIDADADLFAGNLPQLAKVAAGLVAQAGREAGLVGDVAEALVGNVDDDMGELFAAGAGYASEDEIKFAKNRISNDNVVDYVDASGNEDVDALIPIASVETTEVATSMLRALFKPELPNDLSGGIMLDAAGEIIGYELEADYYGFVAASI